MPHAKKSQTFPCFPTMLHSHLPQHHRFPTRPSAWAVNEIGVTLDTDAHPGLVTPTTSPIAKDRTMNTSPRPKYVGIVKMGHHYREPYWDIEAYVWDTLDDVRASVRSVREGRGVAARVAEWNEDGSAYAGHTDDNSSPRDEDVSILIMRNRADVLTLAETDGSAIGRIVH